MADSYYTVIDIDTQQPKKIRLTDNGDGWRDAVVVGHMIG